jgi:hypothetical protein
MGPLKQQMAPQTYREDTHRRASRWAFLGRSSVPPRLNEDSPAVTVVPPPTAKKHDGTYEILNK